MAAAVRYSVLLKAVTGFVAASSLGVLLHVCVLPRSITELQNTTVSTTSSRTARQQNIISAMYGFTLQISEFIWSEHVADTLDSFQVFLSFVISFTFCLSVL